MPEFEERARGLQESLKLVIARVDAGDLEASTAMRYRLEGALVAVSVVLGEVPADSFGVPGLGGADAQGGETQGSGGGGSDDPEKGLSAQERGEATSGAQD